MYRYRHAKLAWSNLIRIFCVTNTLLQIPFPPRSVNSIYKDGLRSRIHCCCRRSEDRFRRRRSPHRRLSSLEGRQDSRPRPQYASAERKCNSTCRPFLDTRLGTSSDRVSSIKGRNLDLGEHWPPSSFSI